MKLAWNFIKTVVLLLVSIFLIFLICLFDKKASYEKFKKNGL